MSRELMKLALEELQNARDHIYLLPENEQPLTEEQILNRINAAITVLHQEVYRDANRTSQKRAGQQEPVAWMHTTGTGHVYFRKKPQDKVFNPQPVFTAPPKQWVGLTDEEKIELWNKHENHWRFEDNLMAFTRAIEAKLKERNTSQERVDEIVKTEHDKQIEIALAYQRGWDAALAQQEPVAWISEGGDVSRSKRYMDEMGFKCNPLYTAPPKREWVGLTLNEAEEFYDKYTDRAELINAIDKFLEEKNT